MAQRDYPYDEGNMTILGPEVFSDGQGAISHQGENYYTLERASILMAEIECAAHGHTWEVIEEVANGPVEVVCTRCTTARRVLDLDDSRRYTALRAAALDLRAACNETGNPVVPTPVAEAIKSVCDLGAGT